MRKILQSIILIASVLIAISCEPEQPALRDLYFQKTWISLTEGEPGFNLPVTIVPEEASEVLITWTSSNPEVATVDHEGNVTIIAAEGETDITATAGEFSATCKLTVSKKKADPEPADDPNPVPDPIYVFGIRIDRTELYLEEGQSGTVKASVSPEDADNQAVYYSSSNTAAATIDAEGRIEAIKAGQTVITATTAEGGFTAYCLVTVYHTPVHVSEVTVSSHSIELGEGAEATLTAAVTPQNADNPAFVWSVSDSLVASVSKTGEITAIKPGETVVYATSEDGGIKDSCIVTVRHVAVPVTGLTMLDDDIIITVGDVYSAVARVEPAEADNRRILWNVEDCSVAEVDTTGIVTALSVGRTILKATSAEGGFEGTCSVTVNPAPIGIEKVALVPAEVILREEQTASLDIVFTPADATNKIYEISSDNEKVAAVTTNGIIVARSVGTATIRIKTVDGAHTASCQVTVTPKYVPVTEVSLDKSSLSLIEGDTAQLSATVLPDNADNKSIRFESSAPDVASVNSYGMITALKAGLATITAVSLDNGLKASASVEVKAAEIPLSAISIDKTSLALHYPDQAQLKAILTPSNATVGEIEWSCGNPEIVKVDNSGNITATGIGNAVVTVSCNGLTAACKVTVEHTIITSVRIDSDQPIIYVESGSTYQCSATVLPENASDKSLTWSSSDTGIATVDANGLVTFGRFGEEKLVTISATSVATPDVVSRQAFGIRKGAPTLIINGTKVFYDYTTGGLASMLSGGRVYTLEFGDVIMNATDIQAIQDKAKTSLNSIDLQKVTFAVDGTEFIGYKINDNVHKVKITGETEVPDYMFYEFSALTDVVLPECTTKIGERVFCDTQLSSLVFPPNTVSVGQGAFVSTPIASVTFNEGLKSIGENLFSAGSHTDNVEEIILPDSVTSIGSDSFFGMTKLKKFRFGPGINAGMNPLSGCTSLTTIEVSEDNRKLKVVDGCLVSSSNTLLLTYPVGLSVGKTDLTIGEGATKITSYSCNYLANTGCVTVAEGITEISNSMQFGTYTALDLPSTLLYIAYNAFMSSSVRSVKVRATTPPSVSGGNLMLSGVSEILVPAASVDAYRTSPYWKQFAGKIRGF